MALVRCDPPARSARSLVGLPLFVSTTDDQLHTTIDTEDVQLPPRCSVLRLVAGPRANARIHDTAALRAVPDGRVRSSMIHVVAQGSHSESLHHAPAFLCASASRCPSRTSAQKRARAALRRLSSRPRDLFAAMTPSTSRTVLIA